MPETPMPLAYRERDPGYRPGRRDDPFNAIVRRCSVKGAATGKLAGKKVGLMLTGRHFDEATLLRVAQAFERSVAWEKA